MLKNSLKYLSGFLIFTSIAISIPTPAASLDNLDINGYFSFEYEECVKGDAGCDENGSFDLDLIDLVFNFQLSNHLRIATDITWEHGTATEDNRGNAAVEYAFAEYFVNDLVKFRAGKMFTHFGIYNEIHTAKPATLTVKEPITTNKNNKLGSEFRFYPRWNTGIAMLGDVEFEDKELNYIIQLSNGDDDKSNPYEKNANKNKAFNSRVRINWNNNIGFGLSYYQDKINHYDGAGVKDGTTSITSYGGQVEYESTSGIGLEAEYVAGKVRTFDQKNINRDAYTLMFYYRLDEIFTPYLRLEHLDPNENIPSDHGKVKILGVNILTDENMYLKFEFNKTTTGANNLKYSGDDFSEIKSSISIGF
ncbi:MAG: hypothetical protein COB30_017490 [Ectothiorhodospiraceae bacterium]|nr:hypothetical protein [Ectothiorhodospiraceae bacterium]